MLPLGPFSSPASGLWLPELDTVLSASNPSVTKDARLRWGQADSSLHVRDTLLSGRDSSNGSGITLVWVIA